MPYNTNGTPTQAASGLSEDNKPSLEVNTSKPVSEEEYLNSILSKEGVGDGGQEQPQQEQQQAPSEEEYLNSILNGAEQEQQQPSATPMNKKGAFHDDARASLVSSYKGTNVDLQFSEYRDVMKNTVDAYYKTLPTNRQDAETKLFDGKYGTTQLTYDNATGKLVPVKKEREVPKSNMSLNLDFPDFDAIPTEEKDRLMQSVPNFNLSPVVPNIGKIKGDLPIIIDGSLTKAEGQLKKETSVYSSIEKASKAKSEEIKRNIELLRKEYENGIFSSTEYKDYEAVLANEVVVREKFDKLKQLKETIGNNEISKKIEEVSGKLEQTHKFLKGQLEKANTKPGGAEDYFDKKIKEEKVASLSEYVNDYYSSLSELEKSVGELANTEEGKQYGQLLEELKSIDLNSIADESEKKYSSFKKLYDTKNEELKTKAKDYSTKESEALTADMDAKTKNTFYRMLEGKYGTVVGKDGKTRLNMSDVETKSEYISYVNSIRYDNLSKEGLLPKLPSHIDERTKQTIQSTTYLNLSTKEKKFYLHKLYESASQNGTNAGLDEASWTKSLSGTLIPRLDLIVLKQMAVKQYDKAKAFMDYSKLLMYTGNQDTPEAKAILSKAAKYGITRADVEKGISGISYAVDYYKKIIESPYETDDMSFVEGLKNPFKTVGSTIEFVNNSAPFLRGFNNISEAVMLNRVAGNVYDEKKRLEKIESDKKAAANKAGLPYTPPKQLNAQGKLSFADGLAYDSRSMLNAYNRISKPSFNSQLGDILSTSISFMGEFMATGGLGKAAQMSTSTFTLKAATSLSERLAVKGIQVAPEYITGLSKTAGWFSRVSATVFAGGSQNISADAIRRLTPDDEFFFSSAGGSFVRDFGGLNVKGKTDNIFEAIAKATATQYAETGTEFLGGSLKYLKFPKPVKEFLGKIATDTQAGRFMSRLLVNDITRKFYDKTGKNLVDIYNKGGINAVNKIMEHAGYNGFIGEAFEEFVNNRITPLIEGENDPMYSDFLGTMKKEAEEITKGIAPFTLFGVGANITTGTYKKVFTPSYSKFSDIYSSLSGMETPDVDAITEAANSISSTAMKAKALSLIDMYKKFNASEESKSKFSTFGEFLGKKQEFYNGIDKVVSAVKENEHPTIKVVEFLDGVEAVDEESTFLKNDIINFISDKENVGKDLSDFVRRRNNIDAHIDLLESGKQVLPVSDILSQIDESDFSEETKDSFKSRVDAFIEENNNKPEAERVNVQHKSMSDKLSNGDSFSFDVSDSREIKAEFNSAKGMFDIMYMDDESKDSDFIAGSVSNMNISNLDDLSTVISLTDSFSKESKEKIGGAIADRYMSILSSETTTSEIGGISKVFDIIRNIRGVSSNEKIASLQDSLMKATMDIISDEVTSENVSRKDVLSIAHDFLDIADVFGDKNSEKASDFASKIFDKYNEGRAAEMPEEELADVPMDEDSFINDMDIEESNARNDQYEASKVSFLDRLKEIASNISNGKSSLIEANLSKLDGDQRKNALKLFNVVKKLLDKGAISQKGYDILSRSISESKFVLKYLKLNSVKIQKLKSTNGSYYIPKSKTIVINANGTESDIIKELLEELVHAAHHTVVTMSFDNEHSEFGDSEVMAGENTSSVRKNILKFYNMYSYGVANYKKILSKDSSSRTDEENEIISEMEDIMKYFKSKNKSSIDIDFIDEYGNRITKNKIIESFNRIKTLKSFGYSMEVAHYYAMNQREFFARMSSDILVWNSINKPSTLERLRNSIDSFIGRTTRVPMVYRAIKQNAKLGVIDTNQLFKLANILTEEDLSVIEKAANEKKSFFNIDEEEKFSTFSQLAATVLFGENSSKNDVIDKLSSMINERNYSEITNFLIELSRESVKAGFESDDLSDFIEVAFDKSITNDNFKFINKETISDFLNDIENGIMRDISEYKDDSENAFDGGVSNEIVSSKRKTVLPLATSLLANSIRKKVTITSKEAKDAIDEVLKNTSNLDNKKEAVEICKQIVEAYKRVSIKNIEGKNISVTKTQLQRLIKTQNRAKIYKYQSDIDLIDKILANTKLQTTYNDALKLRESLRTMSKDSRKDALLFTSIKKLQKINFRTFEDDYKLLDEYKRLASVTPKDVNNIKSFSADVDVLYEEYLKRKDVPNSDDVFSSDEDFEQSDDERNIADMVLNFKIASAKQSGIPKYLEDDLDQILEYKDYMDTKTLQSLYGAIDYIRVNKVHRAGGSVDISGNKEIIRAIASAKNRLALEAINSEYVKELSNRSKDVGFKNYIKGLTPFALFGANGSNLGAMSKYSAVDILNLFEGSINTRAGVLAEYIIKPIELAIASHQTFVDSLSSLRPSSNGMTRTDSYIVGLYMSMNQKPKIVTTEASAKYLNENIPNAAFVVGKELDKNSKDEDKVAYELLLLKFREHLAESAAMRMGENPRNSMTDAELKESVDNLENQTRVKTSEINDIKNKMLAAFGANSIFDLAMSLKESDLTPEQLSYSQKLRNALTETFEGKHTDGFGLKDASSLVGKEMETIDDYFPAIRYKKVEEQADFDDYINNANDFFYGTRSDFKDINDSVIQRRRPVSMPLNIDAGDVVMKRLKQQHFFLANIAHHQFIKEFMATKDGVFDGRKNGVSDELKSIIVSSLKSYYYPGINHSHAAIMNSKVFSKVNEYINNIKPFFVGALSKSIAQQSTQISSMAAMSGNIKDKLKALASANASMINNYDEVDAFMKEHAQEVYYRGLTEFQISRVGEHSALSSFSEILKDIKGETIKSGFYKNEEDASKARSTFNALIDKENRRDMASMFIAINDRFAARASFLAIYNNYCSSRGIKVDYKNPDIMALNHAIEGVRKTQHTSSSVHQSLASKGMWIGTQIPEEQQGEMAALGYTLTSSMFAYKSFVMNESKYMSILQAEAIDATKNGDYDTAGKMLTSMLYLQFGKLAFNVLKNAGNMAAMMPILYYFNSGGDDETSNENFSRYVNIILGEKFDLAKMFTDSLLDNVSNDAFRFTFAKALNVAHAELKYDDTDEMSKEEKDDKIASEYEPSLLGFVKTALERSVSKTSKAVSGVFDEKTLKDKSIVDITNASMFWINLFGGATPITSDIDMFTKELSKEMDRNNQGADLDVNSLDTTKKSASDSKEIKFKDAGVDEYSIESDEE